MNYSLDRLPLFKSSSQVAVLVDLFVVGLGPSSLSEIARRTGVSLAGVHKEIERLENAGLVTSARLGRNRLVEPDASSPFTEDLRSLLVKAFGPPTLLREALEGIDGIESAFIYGSWAKGSGAANDIDLMVISRSTPDGLYDRIRVVEERLRIPVGVTILTPDDWDNADSGFLRSVRMGPKLQIL